MLSKMRNQDRKSLSREDGFFPGNVGGIGIIVEVIRQMAFMKLVGHIMLLIKMDGCLQAGIRMKKAGTILMPVEQCLKDGC